MNKIGIPIFLILICILSLGMLFTGTSAEHALSFVITALICIISGLFLAGRSTGEEKKFLVGIFIYAFLLRVSLALIYFFYLKAQTGGGFVPGGDSAVYDAVGGYIAQAWSEGRPYLGRIGSHPGYYYFLGCAYFLGGHQPLNAIMLNCLLGALTCIYAYKIAKLIYDERIAKITAKLICFFPNLIFWSIVILKDMPIVFSVTFIIWQVLNLNNRLNLSRIFLVFIFGLFLFLFRRVTAAFLILLVINHLIFSKTQNFKLKRILTAIIVLACLGIVFGQYGYGFLGIDTLLIAPERTERIQSSLYAMASFTERESSLILAIMNKPLYLKIPASFVYTLIMPFPPWKVFAIPGIFGITKATALGNLIWYILIPLTIIGVLYSSGQKNKDHRLLLHMIFFIIIAISTAYLGAGARYRAQVMPLCLIFTAVGLTQYKKYRFISLIYYATFGAGVLLYACLKYF